MSKVKCSIENHIATIQLDSPETRNALSTQLKNELIASLDRVEKDESVKIIILTGSEKAFCAGGDIKEMNETTAMASVKKITDTSQIITKIYNMRKLVIAAVNGYAMGAGFSLALSSDIIMADEDARFGLNFVNVGLVPDCGLTYFLGEIFSPWKVKEHIVNGKIFNVQEGKEYQFVNHITEKGNCLNDAKALASELIKKPSNTIWFSKSILKNSQALDQAIEYENYAQTILKQTDDHREGVKAFKEKRKPIFTE